MRVGEVRYLASQPCRFPASLMIGCIAEALTGELTRDRPPGGSKTARWFTREETKAMMAGNPDAFAPPAFAIAHHVIKAWLDRG